MNGLGSGPDTRPARAGRRRVVGLALMVWLVCTVLGAFLIDLDQGPSLVSLPMDHGVGLIDAMGAALLVAGWCAAVVLVRRRAWPLFPPLGRRPAGALLASCAGLVVAALLVPDFEGRKFVVAGFVLLVEAAAAATVLARPEQRGLG